MFANSIWTAATLLLEYNFLTAKAFDCVDHNKLWKCAINGTLKMTQKAGILLPDKKKVVGLWSELRESV